MTSKNNHLAQTVNTSYNGPKCGKLKKGEDGELVEEEQEKGDDRKGSEYTNLTDEVEEWNPMWSNNKPLVEQNDIKTTALSKCGDPGTCTNWKAIRCFLRM
jgi:hypothetical protein